MLRRFFCSIFPSAVALAAVGVGDAAASETPNRSVDEFVIPEPEPIVVDSATTARAQRLLEAVARGDFDRSELVPGLNAFASATTFRDGAVFVRALGVPQSMFAFEKCITADQTSTYFRVRFPKETLTWVVSVDANNRIAGLSLRRGPNNRIFSVVNRDVRY
jgi:hypothetical protein